MQLGHCGVWLRKAMHGNAMQCIRVPGMCWRLTVIHRVSPCMQAAFACACRRPRAVWHIHGVYRRAHACTWGEGISWRHTACVADAKMRLRTRNEKDSVCGLAMISWLLDCRADDYGFASATVSMCFPQGSRITITYRHASSCVILHDHDAIYAIMTHNVVRPLARPA